MKNVGGGSKEKKRENKTIGPNFEGPGAFRDMMCNHQCTIPCYSSILIFISFHILRISEESSTCPLKLIFTGNLVDIIFVP